MINACNGWIWKIHFPRSSSYNPWFSKAHAEKTICSYKVPEFEPFAIFFYLRLVGCGSGLGEM